MKVKKSKILIIYVSLIVLLTYSFPFSSYLKIMSVCGVAALLVSSHFSTKLNSKNTYIYCYIAFGIWGIFSYFWASYPEGVRDQVFNMLVAVLSNVIMTIFITSKDQDLDEILKWFFPVMFIYLVEAIFVGHFNAEGRFSASGAVNQFGISTSYVFLILLYSVKNKKISSKTAYFLIALSGILTIFTGSRKALMNLVLFTCMILLFQKYDRNILKNLGKVVGVIIIIIAFIFAVLNIDALYDVIGKRIVSFMAYLSGNVEEDLSALRRAYMKADAIELFLQHPIIGIGLNNFKYVARYGTYAHSGFYELLCCLGIVGELLYYIPIGISLFISFFHWKKNLPDAIIPFSIFLSVVINEFSNISYIYGIIHVFLGIAAGIMFVNQRRYKLSITQSKGNGLRRAVGTKKG